MYISPTTQTPALATGTPAGTLIARQAIVNTMGKVIGHELFNRSRSHSAHTAASDMMLALTALSHVGLEELMGDTLIFVNCTHESLGEGHLALLDPAKVILEVPPLGHTAAEEVRTRLPTLTMLHERGFRLAFSHTVLESAYAPWLPLADYIKLDLSVLPADQVTVLTKFALRETSAKLIAEKIETAAQLELLTSLGVGLFQGYWLSRPQLVQAKLLLPEQASIDQLSHLLRASASHHDLAQWVMQDAVLTFNLLRLLVTSGVCPVQGPTSIEHAITLLGRHRIACWIGLLQTFHMASESTPTTARTALLHGRFMQLITQAQHLPQAVSDQAFLVGVISQLGQLLDISSASVISLLQLPSVVTSAVLDNTGYLGALLSLARSSEQGHSDELLNAASALGLSAQQLTEARQQALEWARLS